MDALSEWSRDFGPWLWRTSWQGSILILLVMFVQRLAGERITPRWRHALWLLVVLRLASPWVPASRLSVFNWFELKPSSPAVAAQTTAEQITTDHLSTTVPLVSPVNASAPTDPPALRPEESVPLTATESAAAPGPGKGLKAGLLGFWLLGCGLLSGYVLMSTWRLGQCVQTRRPVTDSGVLELLEDCKQQMQLRTPLHLVESSQVTSPSLYGFVRPRLLLPEGLTRRLSLAELRYVFLHELAHVKRGDIPLNWLMTMLALLHWFNPLVWLAWSRMRVDRELACDALALSFADESENQPYGRTVIKLLEGFDRAAMVPCLAGILETKNQINQRIAMIAKFRKTNRRPVLALAVVACLALVALTDAQTSGRKPVKFTGKPPADLALLRVWSCTNLEMQQVVGVSPDGRWMSYMEPDTGDLMLRDLLKGKSQHLTTTSPAEAWKEYATESIISPNGSQVAYTWWTKDDQCQLRVIHRNGTGSRLLYQSPEVGSAWPYGWSSDGRQVVAGFQFGTKPPRRFQIGLVSARDGSVRVLKEIPKGSFRTPDSPADVALSPNGRFLAYDTQRQLGSKDRQIRLLNIEGGQEISLADGPWDNRCFGWSPDGQQLLFASNRRGSTDLWALQVEDGQLRGEPELVKTDLGSVSPMGVTRDGALFYLTEVGSESIQVGKLDMATGRFLTGPTTLVGRFQGHDWEPIWSPDGKQLAYSSIRNGSTVLCVRSMETGREREYSPILLGRYNWPAWSADGKSIRLRSVQGGVDTWCLDLATGQAQPMHLGDYVIYPSTDETIAIRYKMDGPKQILVKNLQSGQEKVLYQFAADEGHYTRMLSPDGRHFAFICAPAEIKHVLKVVPVAGGPVRELLRSDKIISAWAWLPDSRQLLCQIGRDLSLLSIDGQAPRRLGTAPEMSELFVHPDGQQVAFVTTRSQSELWRLENAVPPLEAKLTKLSR